MLFPFKIFQPFFTSIGTLLNMNCIDKITIREFPKTILPLTKFQPYTIHKSPFKHAFIPHRILILTAQSIQLIIHVQAITDQLLILIDHKSKTIRVLLVIKDEKKVTIL